MGKDLNSILGTWSSECCSDVKCHHLDRMAWDMVCFHFIYYEWKRNLFIHSFQIYFVSSYHVEVSNGWRMPVNDTGVKARGVLTGNLDFIHHHHIDWLYAWKCTMSSCHYCPYITVILLYHSCQNTGQRTIGSDQIQIFLLASCRILGKSWKLSGIQSIWG